MPKPTRTAQQLQALLIERIEAIPELRGQVTEIHRGVIVWQEPSGETANWCVEILSDRGVYRADMAQIIRTLQGQFDLEDSRRTSVAKRRRTR